jgi:hypothetical protein
VLKRGIINDSSAMSDQITFPISKFNDGVDQDKTGGALSE